MSRADKLCLAAALEALRDAGLYPPPEKLKERNRRGHRRRCRRTFGSGRILTVIT